MFSVLLDDVFDVNISLKHTLMFAVGCLWCRNNCGSGIQFVSTMSLLSQSIYEAVNLMSVISNEACFRSPVTVTQTLDFE